MMLGFANDYNRRVSRAALLADLANRPDISHYRLAQQRRGKQGTTGRPRLRVPMS
jgi:hypothetical protein